MIAYARGIRLWFTTTEFAKFGKYVTITPTHPLYSVSGLYTSTEGRSTLAPTPATLEEGHLTPDTILWLDMDIGQQCNRRQSFYPRANFPCKQGVCKKFFKYMTLVYSSKGTSYPLYIQRRK